MGSDAGADADTARCPLLDEGLAFERTLYRRQCEQVVACASDAYGTNGTWACTWTVAPQDPVAACDRLASGDVVFHPDRAAACLAATDALTALPCRGPALRDGLALASDACSDVWTRPPPSPSGCSGSFDCGLGETCAAAPTCGGTCLALRPLGAACDDVLYRCSPGSYCDPVTRTCTDSCADDPFACGWSLPGGPVACVGGRCRIVDVAPGDPCVVDDSGGSVCSFGQHCSPDAVCVEPVSLGGACDPRDFEACGPRFSVTSYFCDPTLQVCTNPSAHCFLQADGTALGCDAAHPYCGPDNICYDDPLVQQCEPYAPSDRCPDGLVCVSSGYPSFCRETVAVGAACDGSLPCVTGSTCSGGTCVRLVVPWEPCGPSARCPSGMFCSGTVCVVEPSARWADLGDACDATTSCSDGFCLDGVCGFRSPGDACLSWHECFNGCGTDQRCNDFQIVGEGEACDDTRRCQEGLLCLVVAGDVGQPVTSVCQRSCTP